MFLLFDLTIQNRRVVLITNVKPGKLRDVMSQGLVLMLILVAFAKLICGDVDIYDDIDLR